jgi:hypothetical protein
MTRPLIYLQQGWRPHGPGKCRCYICGGISSTNALARAKHICKPPAKLKPATTPASERK